MTTSYHPAARPGAGLRSRELLQIAAVAGAALLFGVLLVLVRLQWVPLESVDRGLAAALNNAVAGHRPVVLALGFATRLGSHGVLLWLLAIASVVLLVRRRSRLVVFLVVSGIGSVILDPALKAAVGRLRPVVAHPVAIGGGDSFPSGHSLGSIIVYGALLMVFVPALPRRWRALAIAAAVVLVLAVGFTRLALGVHFLSDVLGAWALGVAWLGLTAYATELWRVEAGLRPTQPLTEGLEPEAARDLKPTRPVPHAEVMRARWAVPGGLVAWVLVFGAFCDALDGAVARARGVASDAGEVLDAAIDRWAEMAVFFGYAWYYRSIWWGFILAAGACVGAIMVSYARAKAESFGIDAAMGLMQRHERAVWLALATLGSAVWELWRPTPIGMFAFHTPVLVALGVIAVLANWTGWIRTQYTREELRKR